MLKKLELSTLFAYLTKEMREAGYQEQPKVDLNFDEMITAVTHRYQSGDAYVEITLDVIDNSSNEEPMLHCFLSNEELLEGASFTWRNDEAQFSWENHWQDEWREYAVFCQLDFWNDALEATLQRSSFDPDTEGSMEYFIVSLMTSKDCPRFSKEEMLEILLVFLKQKVQKAS